MKNPIFRGLGSRKTNIEGERFPKRRAWTVCRFKGWGGLGKKEDGVLLKGGLITSMHTMEPKNKRCLLTLDLKPYRS